MSHKHEQLLRTIFHDPISANIHWREVESLLNHVGADIESLSGARIRVKLNGAEGSCTGRTTATRSTRAPCATCASTSPTRG